jgi:alkylation response protein AidB-like acyl-CoA dehydrogenase
MDLSWSDTEQAFRAEARTWLEANVPRGLASGDTREGFSQHLEWERLLHANRYAAVSWPEEFGGRGASLWEWLIFEEEYYRVGAPQRVTQNGIFLLAPTIFEFGTPAQREWYLPRMSAAEDLWCQGWSEPNAGSDLAGITSRAVRDGDGWRLSGQKTWTTRGAFCTHLFGLFRTDPNETRHRGLTYLLVPLDADGVTVRGFDRLDGDEGFAEVFFDDAWIPDGDGDPDRGGRLGEVGKGWGVAMATTTSERGLTLRSPGRFQAAAAELLSTMVARGETDEVLRDRVAQAWIDAEAYALHTLGDVSSIVAGGSPGARSSLNKIFWSELDVRLQRAGLDLLGPTAQLGPDAMKAFQFALSGPIYAGTNEIQRTIVAERVLGLPRV